jgi:hypothetical protein
LADAPSGAASTLLGESHRSDSEGVGRSSSWREVSWRELRALAAVLLPGLYAWGATVAWPVFSQRAVSVPARVGALVGVVALFLGLGVARSHPIAGRAIGVLGCLGCSAIAWGALGNGLRASELDPMRAALGALGWGLFALGWGGFPARLRPLEELESAASQRLPSRGRLPTSTRVGFFVLVAFSLALPLLAWRVERPGVSLLAHAVALAGSVSLLNVGTRILIARPESEHRSAPRLWLILCSAWLLLGLLLWLL